LPAIRLAIPLLSIVLAIGGCTVGPDFVTPKATLQEQWREKGDPQFATNAAVNNRWWKTFNDPALDKLVQLALQNNLPLQTAGIRILEARAQLGIAIGLQYPQTQQLFAGLTGVGLSNNAPNVAGSARSYYDYQAGFDASWEIDFWGKYRRGVEADRATLTASVADYDNAIVSLTAEVARTYVTIRTFEAFIALARDNISVQEDGLKMAESRFRHGATTELDVTQARTLLESTRSTVPELEAGLRQAENALSTLLGQPTGAVRPLLGGPKAIPTPPPKVAVGMPAQLLCRRPDIRRADLDAAAQCARIGIAKTDFYPSVSIFGTVGFETSSGGGFQSNGAQFHNLFDVNSLFFAWGPSVRWPILNYGRIQNNVRVQDARFQELVVDYQNVVLNAAQEVEDASIGFLKAQQSAAMLQISVDAAKRSVSLATSQYKEGAVDYQRVLDSESSMLDQENRLAQTRSSIATNLVALYKALGGGWELRQGEPFISPCNQEQMKQRTNWGPLLPPAPKPESLDPPPPAHDTPVLQKPQW
jgi:NodT family efflux transporter outer membrane factor (OMF) lipoprotein